MGGESFIAGYRERAWAENVREGRSYFERPSQVPVACSERYSLAREAALAYLYTDGRK